MQFIYQSPLGPLLLTEDGGFITGLYFQEEKGETLEAGKPVYSEPDNLPDQGVISLCIQELDEYFKKERTVFTVPLKLIGTEFRKRTWGELLNIPYGKTISYKQLAESIENPKAIRAVGGANHYNPIAIIVPCHRVVGADGSLTGYGGGMWRKKWLLEHEGVCLY